MSDPAASRRQAPVPATLAPPVAPLNLLDFEPLALARLEPGVAAYYGGAAADEVTLGDNLAAFRRWRLVPRMGIEIEPRDPSVEVLGRRWPAPVMVAPMALMRMADPEGEVAVARACAARGLVMSVSTVASATIEEVAAAGATTWFQLYLLRDAARNLELLQRTEVAGCEALIVTMDAPILGRRERDLRTGFRLPDGIHYANIRRGGIQREDTYGDDEFKRSNTWADLAWVAAHTRLPVVVKGVLHPDDARRAIGEGAAAIGVSNHGGRQVDLTVAALDALPAVVDAVGGRVPVLFDGGIRRGTDVLMALALGARAVMLGRPLLWALAWGGEAGAGLAFDLLLAEFDQALALTGVARSVDARRELLVRAGELVRQTGGPAVAGDGQSAS